MDWTVSLVTLVAIVSTPARARTSSDSPAKFNSKAIDTDEKFSYVFTQPGTYPYFCAVHPKMTAKIVVK